MQFDNKSENLDHQIEQLEYLRTGEGEAACELPALDPAPHKKSVRRPLHEQLPRDEKVCSPSSEACLACGYGLRPLGVYGAKQLEFVPVGFHVIGYMLPKLACSCCDAIVQA